MRSDFVHTWNWFAWILSDRTKMLMNRWHWTDARQRTLAIEDNSAGASKKYERSADKFNFCNSFWHRFCVPRRVSMLSCYLGSLCLTLPACHADDGIRCEWMGECEFHLTANAWVNLFDLIFNWIRDAFQTHSRATPYAMCCSFAARSNAQQKINELTTFQLIIVRCKDVLDAVREIAIKTLDSVIYVSRLFRAGISYDFCHYHTTTDVCVCAVCEWVLCGLDWCFSK